MTREPGAIRGAELRRAVALLMLLALSALVACAAPGSEFARNGQRLVEQGRVEAGLAEIGKAIGLDPGNSEYRMLDLRLRDKQIGQLLAQADAQRAAGRIEQAEASYRRVIGLDNNNLRGLAALDGMSGLQRQEQQLAEASSLHAEGRTEEADQRLRQLLAENPLNARAQALRQRIDAGRVPEAAPALLKPALRKPVSLDFRDANLKSVFEALSRTTGINFVFDREIKPDIKVTLTMSNMSIEDVIGVLTLTNQLERKTIGDNTVLIYPNTPLKQKEYLDLNVKTFYLANAEAKTVFTMLKTVLKTKDLYADERLNSLTMRDTGDAIRLAEKLIASQDLPEPEVLLEVEVLEVKRSRLSEIGVDPPGKFTVLNLVPNPATIINGGGAATTVIDSTLTSTQLTLDKLRNIRGASVGIDNPSVNIRAENGDTNILANPRIRVRNRDKARILIGDRVPVITTTSTANVGVSESVSYLDVGLKLDVEPIVFLDNEVGVKIGLEVSNIVREVRSRTGTLTYQIGTRVATTSLRLRDGETQALAGLINDEDRRTAAGVPGLIDLPLVGRLFSSERADRNKTEIVLLITPRVVRNLNPGALERTEHRGGTESTVGAPPLRVRGAGKIATAPMGTRDATSGAEPTNTASVEAAPASAATSPEPAPAPAPGDPKPGVTIQPVGSK